MPARLKASAVFLTYSQVGDVPRDDLVAFLTGIPFVNGGIACLELHQDGGRHFHAWVDLKSQSTFTNDRFDLNGLHPNVIICPGHKKSDASQNRIEYCKKDKDWVYFPDGYEPPSKKEADTTWQDVITAESREEALAIVATNRPRDAVINARQIDYFLEKKFGEKVVLYVPDFPRDSFTRVPPILDEWVMGSLGELLILLSFFILTCF